MSPLPTENDSFRQKIHKILTAITTKAAELEKNISFREEEENDYLELVQPKEDGLCRLDPEYLEECILNQKRIRLDASTPIRYLSADEIKTAKDLPQFTTNNSLYIISPNKELHFVPSSTARKNTTKIRHSSFLHGQPVMCAGYLTIKNGFITRIDNASGHYKPNPEAFTRAITVLAEQKLITRDTVLRVVTGQDECKDPLFAELNLKDILSSKLYEQLPTPTLGSPAEGPSSTPDGATASPATKKPRIIGIEPVVLF